MKKIFISVVLIFILLACTNTADDAGKNNPVDTSVIGSDKPDPITDTIVLDTKADSIKK